jgi:hypothetical protein
MIMACYKHKGHRKWEKKKFWLKNLKERYRSGYFDLNGIILKEILRCDERMWI